MDIEWKEEGWSLDAPTAVITLEIGGMEYIIDLLTYNENIELGKTKFVTIRDEVHMVTPEQYKLLMEANNLIKNK